MPTLAATPVLSLKTPATKRATQICILADDLTGACDSAVAFLAAGHTVRVWLGPQATGPVSESVQAFNTNSRSLEPEPAMEAVFRAAKPLSSAQNTLFFVKVDSAGRSHYTAEILAAHRTLGTHAVLFAPSFPANGRVVKDGILYVQDGSETSYVPLIILFQNDALTAQIQNPSQIPRALAARNEILVCDASTQAELEAYAVLHEPKLLYAGSAGLACALAKFHPGPCKHAHSLPSAATAITISGTPHPITRKQLKHLAKALPSHPRLEIRAKASDAPTILDHFHRHASEALILTGGNTALLVLQTLAAHSILLRGELAPGIPWGVIQGGLADGRIVITKSGGFGTPDALTRILKSLQGAA